MRRGEVKSKGENERYTHLKAEFQKICSVDFLKLNQVIFDHCFMDWWLFLLLVQPVFQHQVDEIVWFVHLLIHHLTKSNWEPVTF